MKKLLAFLCVSFLIISAAFAQSTTLKVSLSNSTSTSCHIWLPDIPSNIDNANKGSLDIPLNTTGKGTHRFIFTKPEWASLWCASSDSNGAKSFHYLLYLSPGDQIDLKADFNAKDNGIVVTGKGSNNNQPLLSAFPRVDNESLYGDTLPDRIKASANKHQAEMKHAFDEYLATYKPSADFIKNERVNIQYAAVDQYFDFKENNKFQIRKQYEHTETKWRAMQDSLFATVKLNNDDAINTLSYISLVRTFMLREKERLWSEKFKNPEAFFKEWYNADVATGQKEYDDDQSNALQEKIINHYFSGQPAELLYAQLIDGALGEHNPKNLAEIFDRFKQKYPHSRYINWFSPTINTIRQKENRALTSDMVFVAGNGTNLNTFEDLLALTKGKTVLLDMWGTWCGPCRNEISDNGAAIKEYFKGKGLDYFYVANRDLNHQETWKKLIAYFDMKGTHILANDNLSKDIMAKVKGPGYPTYVVIKKDGSYELSKAGYPMKRDVLIKQLEEALKE
ncbi:MAG TPA: TlpA disulfide reductase family protein [Mucilaginibacter sp.]|nr:TlpA disulfide reductase family protein [Mucilaginibacter sp.]